VTEAGTNAVHYEADIKPLFRTRDQQAMKFAFDCIPMAMSANMPTLS
jgi:hypothetical protein